MPPNLTELLAEEVVREVHKAPVSADFQIHQGRGWGTKEAGRVDFGTVHALDGQGSRSRDMGNDASKHLEVWWRIKLHLGPFEICECPVDIVGLPVNRKQVQRDGWDIRMERQCRQTCAAVTRTRSLFRCRSTLDRISGGSLFAGKHAFRIVLVFCRTSRRSHSMSEIRKP